MKRWIGFRLSEIPPLPTGFIFLFSTTAAWSQSGQPNAQPLQPPPYKFLRQDEDWTMMRDPARRVDWSDELKYIRIGKRDEWHLSIGGEARPWYELYRNELRGSGVSEAVHRQLVRSGKLRLRESVRDQQATPIIWESTQAAVADAEAWLAASEAGSHNEKPE